NACGVNVSNPVTLNVYSFSLSPASQNFSASGSNGSVSVIAQFLCGWTATSNAAWISITSGGSGSGNGSGDFCDRAKSGAKRIGTLTIAEQTLTVNQDGAVPTPTPTPSPTATPTPPDFTITKTHAGNFAQGSSGNTYVVVVSNSGAGNAISGQAVSVTD